MTNCPYDKHRMMNCPKMKSIDIDRNRRITILHDSNTFRSINFNIFRTNLSTINYSITLWIYCENYCRSNKLRRGSCYDWKSRDQRSTLRNVPNAPNIPNMPNGPNAAYMPYGLNIPDVPYRLYVPFVPYEPNVPY